MLFKFLLIIFLIGFTLVSLLGFSVLRSFRDFFFGSSKSNQRSASQSRQGSRTKGSTNHQKQSKKKIITDDEGEYVDYEEINE
jgi:hypothetical protein